MTGAMAPTKPLNANDLCDRCGAQAYVRVMLPGSVESFLGKGQNVWAGIFVGLGISLAVAGLLLAPLWNRLPPKAA